MNKTVSIFPSPPKESVRVKRQSEPTPLSPRRGERGGVRGEGSLKGFTFIELMVAMVVLLIVMGGAYALFSSGRIFWFSQGAVITVQDEAREALDYISIELTQAVDLDSNPATMAVDGLTTAPVNSIAFKIPVYCNGPFDPGVNPDGDGFWVNVGADNYYIESVTGQTEIDAGAYLAGENISSADPARTDRRIIYSVGGLNNSQLIRTVQRISDSTQLDMKVLANNITGLRFSKRNTFTAPAVERRIIIVEADVSKNIFPGRDAVGDPVNTISMSTRVTLRN